jgi:hypothetical protein
VYHPFPFFIEFLFTIDRELIFLLQESSDGQLKRKFNNGNGFVSSGFFFSLFFFS